MGSAEALFIVCLAIMIGTAGDDYWTLGGSTRNIGPQDSVVMGNFQGASCILGPWEIDMEGGSMWGRFLKVSINYVSKQKYFHLYHFIPDFSNSCWGARIC